MLHHFIEIHHPFSKGKKEKNNKNQIMRMGNSKPSTKNLFIVRNSIKFIHFNMGVFKLSDQFD